AKQKSVQQAAKSLSVYEDLDREEFTLIDCLTDLMHWSDVRGVDFEWCLGRAETHYETEVASEREVESPEQRQSLSAKRPESVERPEPKVEIASNREQKSYSKQTSPDGEERSEPMSAWRPWQNLREGLLDNTRPGRV